MQQEDQALARRCRALAENSRAAQGWLDDNRELAGSEYDSLQATLRRAGRMFAKCETAALRKMCVGVFGPSQSGKSYLISTLASPQSGPLMADFDGEERNFITEINPEGGKESTGLVTRFTTTPPPGLPTGYPIRLRLLSESDVVRVLANTYYADCDHKEPPDQDALLALLAQLEGRCGAAPADGNAEGGTGMESDEVEDLREYVNRNFASRPRAQMLQRAYWQRAAELAPLLELEDRATLFGCIWDGVEEFTQLYLRLCTALRDLGHPAEAWCPIEALIPRASSIIDVALLKDLAQSGGDSLTVMGAKGRTASLPRSVVTALTAEITIYMREKPDEFFDYTDLLDFPGYRSRLKLDDLRKELTREGTLENLFLRGKVAYLFERYCAERELTSMLLCIGPGNQEVQDLPRAVQQWIATTHGAIPAQRAGHAPALFFVLSKMDVEFEKKEGSPSVEGRWNTRLQSSLLDFFGKSDDWPTNWDGQHAFNNVFLLRNPKFRCEAIFSFENNRESGIRPDQQAFVEEVRSAFINSPLVKTHVANPERVWNAAMTLNDGGVGLLREVLRPLCNPALKRGQIAVTLNQLLERLTTALSSHWKSDDKDEERKRKELLARQLAGILAGLAEAQLFGEFLRALQVNDHDLHALYFRAEQERLQQENAAPSVVVGTRVSADDILGDIFGPAPTEAAAPAGDDASPPENRAYRDEAERFTDLVIGHWVEQLHTLAASPAVQARFRFPERELGLFVHEMALSLTRLGIPARMATAQRQAAGYGNLARERLVWKQVSLAADAINAFVDWQGFDPRYNDDAQRTIVMQGRPVTLFTPPPPLNGPVRVNEELSAYDRAWYADWLRAFVHSLSANVDFEGGAVFNVEQNNRLRAILDAFAPTVAA